MTKLNIEQLRKEAAKLAEINMIKIKEAAEIGKLKAMIALNSNEALLNAKARLMMTEQDTSKLQSLIKECAEIISSTPMYNEKARANRKWAGQHRYGFGSQVDAVYELATGILYSCQEHKELLLAHTGLNTELLTNLVESFGNPSYYSRNNNVVIAAVPVNVDELNAALSIVQSELNVVINTSKLTKANFATEYLKAEINADKQFELSAEAISQADLEL